MEQAPEIPGGRVVLFGSAPPPPTLVRAPAQQRPTGFYHEFWAHRRGGALPGYPEGRSPLDDVKAWKAGQSAKIDRVSFSSPSMQCEEICGSVSKSVVAILDNLRKFLKRAGGGAAASAGSISRHCACPGAPPRYLLAPLSSQVDAD